MTREICGLNNKGPAQSTHVCKVIPHLMIPCEGKMPNKHQGSTSPQPFRRKREPNADSTCSFFKILLQMKIKFTLELIYSCSKC